VAILGASGIGNFHARDFKKVGCDVCAILGSTEESSLKTAAVLRKKFDIDAQPYHDLEKLLKKELDAVAVCTPPSLHYSQVKRCLEEGLHVLCEKPFVLNTEYQGLKMAEELMALAGQKKKILSVNTQWSYVLSSIKDIVGEGRVHDFSMIMEPGVQGVHLLTDSVPHMNSLLVRIIPRGNAREIEFLLLKENEVKINFLYSNLDTECNVTYHMKFKQDKPRHVEFSLNNHSFSRIILPNYDQELVYENIVIPICDPFTESIREFVSSLENNYSSLKIHQEILENVKLQDALIKKYLLM